MASILACQRTPQQEKHDFFARIGRCSPFRQRVLLVCLCLALYCTWWLQIPLTELDEAIYGEVAREMTASQHYLIPHYNFTPFYEKPVLSYWLQVAAMRVFGANEMALRLPSALCALALVLLLHAFLLRWLVRPGLSPPARARANGVVLLGGIAAASMPVIAMWARVATMDMVTTLFITGAILALLHADLLALEPEGVSSSRLNGCYLLGALSAGLAFLSKGPVGIVVPGLIWVIFHLRQGDLRATVRRVPWVAATLLFLIVAVPWYLATLLYDGPQFLRTFFLHENLARFAAAPREGHGFNASILGHLEGLCLYPLIALVILFPCSAFLAGDLCTPFAGNDACRLNPLLVRLRRFAWIWLLAIIGLFSLSKTQLPNYILAIAGGAVILFTLHLLARVSPVEAADVPAAAERRWARGVELFLLALLGLVFSLLPIYVLGINKMHDVPLAVMPLPQPAAKIVMALAVIVGIFFQLGLWYYRRRRGEFALFALAAWVPVYVLFFATAMLYLHSEYAGVVQIGEYLRRQPAAAQVVVYHKRHPQSLVFHAQRTVAFYTAPKQTATLLYNAPQVAPTLAEELRRQALAGHSVLLVTNEQGLRDVRRLTPAEVMQHFGAILVARITPQAYLSAGQQGRR